MNAVGYCSRNERFMVWGFLWKTVRLFMNKNTLPVWGRTIPLPEHKFYSPARTIADKKVTFA